MNRRIEPLSQEERDLAERLTRLGGPSEPAPALDAAILAAARAAVGAGATTTAPVAGSTPATTPTASANPAPSPSTSPAPIKPGRINPNSTRGRRGAPRWTWGLGLAATVVLAGGIGWKLQLESDERPTVAESAMAAASDADDAIEAVMIEREPTPAPPPPPPLADAEAPALGRVAQAPAAKSAPAGAADAAAFADTAEPVVAYSASAPAPMAPAAPPAEPELDIKRESKAVFEMSDQAPRTNIPSDRAAGAAEYTRTPLSQRRQQESRADRNAQTEALPPPPPPPPQSYESPRDRARNARGEPRTDSGVADKPVTVTGSRLAGTVDGFDDRPPVAADSPEFRQAWLQRIRGLLADGDTAGAAESLQEFRRRYPDAELPEDLRKLAATLPPPTPAPTP